MASPRYLPPRYATLPRALLPLLPRFDTNITPFSLAMSFAPATAQCHASPSRHVYFRHLCAITLLLIITLFMPLCFYYMSCCFADAAATHDYADAFDYFRCFRHALLLLMPLPPFAAACHALPCCDLLDDSAAMLFFADGFSPPLRYAAAIFRDADAHATRAELFRRCCWPCR